MLASLRAISIGLLLSIATVAFFVTARDTAPSFQKCQSSKYGAESSSKEQPERPALFFERILAFNCTARFLEAHNAVITAIATVILTFVTGGLVWTGYQQIRTTRSQLRAYVTIATGDCWRQGGKLNLRFEFRPVIINVGQTPAYRVNSISGIRYLSLQEAAAFDYEANLPPMKPVGVLTLGNNQNRFTSIILDRKLTLAELRKYRKGTHIILIYGKVVYRDIFERKRTTRYSYAISVWGKRGAPLWNTTNRHNDSD